MGMDSGVERPISGMQLGNTKSQVNLKRITSAVRQQVVGGGGFFAG